MKFNGRLIGCLLLLFSFNSVAAKPVTLRLGILAFGTVAWEIEALKQQKLLDSAAFDLEIHPVANPEAGKIALQSGAVDIIVSDWIWVSKLRASGEDFTFYPYSNTSGALVVPENSPIRSLKDLPGKRLGLAGGELDKNWLLLQALGQRQSLDLNASVEKVFGAPPILSQQLLRQRLDAVMTYWHFAARLEAQGYRQVLDGRDIVKGLGINEAVPTLGYVFRQSFGEQHRQSINSFLNSTRQVRQTLCQSDSAWQKIIPLTQAEDTVTQNKLRLRYCDGNIDSWGEKERQAAGRIYQLLKNLSDNRLTGAGSALQPGTFWSTD
ncbi:MAG: ABC transporter substrate-binding protein [Gammaproteobacteria bacterium HGW-Gammaproteobacteria-3]|nr:MAG: ABC transporter substrate-binding protein [Gammaproteobacteria bacterium HGW-Gammaproteobacteria-3]